MAKDKKKTAVSTGVTTAGSTKYGYHFEHDLEAKEVQPKIEEKKKEYGNKYVDHSILPESDGQFTVMFIYLAD